MRFSFSFMSQPTLIQQNVFKVTLEYLAYKKNIAYQKFLAVNKKKMLIRKQLSHILQQNYPEDFRRCRAVYF